MRHGDGPSVILVGMDGSDTSLRAAAYAAGLARRQGSELAAVYVETTPALAALAGGAYGEIRTNLELIAAQLKDQLDRFGADVGITPRFIVAQGDPHTEITRIADDERVDALVVGASGQAGHKVIGSLGIRLVRSGKWPVTVVP